METQALKKALGQTIATFCQSYEPIVAQVNRLAWKFGAVGVAIYVKYQGSARRTRVFAKEIADRYHGNIINYHESPIIEVLPCLFPGKETVNPNPCSYGLKLKLRALELGVCEVAAVYCIELPGRNEKELRALIQVMKMDKGVVYTSACWRMVPLDMKPKKPFRIPEPGEPLP